jgi:mannose-6-phosphate isomerase
MWQLTNTVRHYPWGSRTVIPELLGEPCPAE